MLLFMKQNEKCWKIERKELLFIINNKKKKFFQMVYFDTNFQLISKIFF